MYILRIIYITSLITIDTMKSFRITLTTIFILANFLMISCSSELPSSDISENNEKIGNDIVLPINDVRENMFNILSIIEGRKSRSVNKVISSEYMIHVGARSRSESDYRSFYVFNFENDEGFAIMTSDSKPSTLVALADSGNLVPDQPIDNPGLVCFLAKAGKKKTDDSDDSDDIWRWSGPYKDPNWRPYCYTEGSQHEVFQWDPGISKGDNSGPKPSTPNNPEEEYTIKYTNHEVICEVQPICLADWGQGSCYNGALDDISAGVKPKTGSLATAIGEIMFAYQYPVTLSGDTIPWTRMKARIPMINGTFDMKAKTIRSRLLKTLGSPENLDMQYGKDYSYASPENVMRTLAAFGYSGTGVLNDYDSQEVLSEIKNGYIAILGGSSTESGERMHYWIIDGCKEMTCFAEAYNSKNELVDTMTMVSRYLRCNWGCEGKHNGFYSANSFNATIDFTIKNIDDVITITPIDSTGVDKPVLMPTRRRSTDPDLQNYKYNLQAITGIRK